MRSYDAGEVLHLELGERHRLIGLQKWESSPRSGSTPPRPHRQTSLTSCASPMTTIEPDSCR